MNKIIFSLISGLLILLLLVPSAFSQQQNDELSKLENQIELPICIPQGDKQHETNTTNGIDDDNDGIIDEGENLGTCMIIIYNNNHYNDDEWELIVDGKSEGYYRKGKARFWDLMLEKGMHKVYVKAAFDIDNTGNYSIWFNRCKPIKGPSLEGFNDTEKSLYEWHVEVK